MTLTTENIVEIGTEVTLLGGANNGARARIEGHGTVVRNRDIPFGEGERVTAYEVEIIADHVGHGDKVLLEGERLLLYRGHFTTPQEFDVAVTYEFSARVKADDRVQATEAFVTALVDALTFDGDDDAPEPLVELQMRRVG